jgi:hypothetical protein
MTFPRLRLERRLLLFIFLGIASFLGAFTCACLLRYGLGFLASFHGLVLHAMLVPVTIVLLWLLVAGTSIRTASLVVLGTLAASVVILDRFHFFDGFSGMTDSWSAFSEAFGGILFMIVVHATLWEVAYWMLPRSREGRA